MIKKISRNKLRIERHQRAKKVRGTAEKPRMCVFRSLKHLYVQVIDDNAGKTVVGIGSNVKVFKDQADRQCMNKENAVLLGKLVAQECLKKEIKNVVFDRNGYKFHGRIKALADAAREEGLSF